MEYQQKCPQSYEALIAAIGTELDGLSVQTETAKAQFETLSAEQAARGEHPNRTAYVHGGLVAVRNMGASHILAHAGFYWLPHGEAMARLGCAREESDENCLIMALRIVCESDPQLEVAGLAWLAELGLLKHGEIDPFWLRRPLLGLGQPAKLHGLTADQAAGHRGLYTLVLADLARQFASVATCDADTFGTLLPGAIELGGVSLAARGAQAIERDAAQRYEAGCASFAAHQRATDDRRWRWKPPFSRQGHLAVTTARVRDVPVPSERTRGHAAGWLSDNGANVRFRKD